MLAVMITLHDQSWVPQNLIDAVSMFTLPLMLSIEFKMIIYFQ